MKYNTRLKIVILALLLVLMGSLGTGCVPGTLAGGGSAGVVADGTLYLGSLSGQLLAINAQTGSRLWSVTLEQPAQGGGFGCAPTKKSVAIYGTPAVSGELVYVVGYDGRLRVYREGVEQSRYPAKESKSVGSIVGGPRLALGNVYFGTSSGEVIALDVLDDGNLVQKWRVGVSNGEVIDLVDATKAKEWQSNGRNRVWSTPVILGDTVYVTSMDNKLYALDADTGTKKWEFTEAEGAIVSPPVIYDGFLYFGSFDRHFYAVSAETGQLRWRSEVQAERWFWAKPLVHNDAVYAGALDGRVYVFNAATGENLAVRDLGAPLVSAPVLSGDDVIFVTSSGDLYALDTKHYQVRELAAGVEGKVYAPLTLSDGVIYIHAQDPDTLYAVRADTGVNIWSVPLGSK